MVGVGMNRKKANVQRQDQHPGFGSNKRIANSAQDATNRPFFPSGPNSSFLLCVVRASRVLFLCSQDPRKRLVHFGVECFWHCTLLSIEKDKETQQDQKEAVYYYSLCDMSDYEILTRESRPQAILWVSFQLVFEFVAVVVVVCCLLLPFQLRVGKCEASQGDLFKGSARVCFGLFCVNIIIISLSRSNN